jgi:cytochrome c oxidase cbb3-type subunit 3/ubiquinol-cytochrome c reductase cytochrome c subunit
VPQPGTGSGTAGAGSGSSAPGSPVAAGAALYARYCTLCHGPEATGYAADNAPSLVSETLLATASDAFLARSIGRGRPGTAMAGYHRDVGGPLDDAGVAAIIAFLRQRAPARLVLPDAPARGDVAAGKAVFDAQCASCHVGPPRSAPMLTNPELLAAADDSFLRHAIRKGRPGTPMRGYEASLTGQQIDDILVYLRSAPTPPPKPAAAPPPPPPPTDVVINPGGKAPKFTVRDGRFVPVDEVKKALDARQRMVIIDARAASDWRSARIPGAISVPYYELDKLSAVPNDDTWVLAYCACPHHASGVVVDELRKRGYRNTAILDEGVLVWQQRGYPIVGTGEDPHAGHGH